MADCEVTIYPAQFRPLDEATSLRNGERLYSDLSGTLVAVKPVETWEKGGLVEEENDG